jgi:hypothetical protein
MWYIFYDIVSFLIPNPQHTVSLYTFIYQESVWSGRSGLSLREYPEILLNQSNWTLGIFLFLGIIDYRSVPVPIVPMTGGVYIKDHAP